ncbi:hypothetical protein B0T14DRAFT_237374 [Immersiella caudata]|uniref:Uncharacterized protein n=1 Tax=Immersiella caudata TaxID=314043 RepID=A0AA39WT20_9PEZI|nr:hypothetical protein B0T14DRAFT_237374 [Immersiella caudata]
MRVETKIPDSSWLPFSPRTSKLLVRLPSRGPRPAQLKASPQKSIWDLRPSRSSENTESRRNLFHFPSALRYRKAKTAKLHYPRQASRPHHLPPRSDDIRVQDMGDLATAETSGSRETRSCEVRGELNPANPRSPSASSRLSSSSSLDRRTHGAKLSSRPAQLEAPARKLQSVCQTTKRGMINLPSIWISLTTLRSCNATWGMSITCVSRIPDVGIDTTESILKLLGLTNYCTSTCNRFPVSTPPRDAMAI